MAAPREIPDALLTAEEVAKMLQMSVAYVRRMASEKPPLLPSIKLGKCVRFRRRDVLRFIGSMERSA